MTDIGLLVNPAGTLAEVQIRDVKEAVEGPAQRLHVANVSSESEIDAAFAALSQSKVGALVIGTDPLLRTADKSLHSQHVIRYLRFIISANIARLAA
jgi:hypothetical protein